MVSRSNDDNVERGDKDVERGSTVVSSCSSDEGLRATAP